MSLQLDREPRARHAYLDTGFRQADFERNFLAHENVGVARLRKERFEDVELRTSECGAFATLFARGIVGTVW